MALLDGIERQLDRATSRVVGGGERATAGIADVVANFTERYSPLVLGQLRQHRPIISTRWWALVTCAKDVHQVLDDFEHFHVMYEPKMEELGGPFILGLDGGDLYWHDHNALRAAIRPADLPVLEGELLGEARQRVRSAVAGNGQIDVVSGLVDPTIDAVISEYFGAPGPNTATQLRWARSLFDEIFINVSNQPYTRKLAIADAAEMRPHIDQIIAIRRAEFDAGRSLPDDVITRLMQATAAGEGLDDLGIRNNLIGLIAGWIPTVSKAFALIVEELLNRPLELAAAQVAARHGDTELVAAYAFEALRFRPQNFALLRKCGASTVIAAGTDRETTIHEGATVFVATQSAMFDERVVEAPEAFRLDRPWSDYLHFGHGLHQCFGLAINRTQLPAMLTALLEGGPISRAPGEHGRLQWAGPYPSHLGVVIGN